MWGACALASSCPSCRLARARGEEPWQPGGTICRATGKARKEGVYPEFPDWSLNQNLAGLGGRNPFSLNSTERPLLSHPVFILVSPGAARFPSLRHFAPVWFPNFKPFLFLPPYFPALGAFLRGGFLWGRFSNSLTF